MARSRQAFKQPFKSMQFQLIFWSVLALLLLAVIAGGYGFWYSYKELNDFQDDSLKSMSALLEQTLQAAEKIAEKTPTILEKFTNNIKKYLTDVQNGDYLALVFLLMASFIYGVIHAFGPGHGKALAFSYFSSQKSSFFEAFVISLVTAFIHILGALAIVLFSVFILSVY